MIITQIRRGRRGNSLLFCDGEYIVSLNTEVVLKNGIKVGMYVDEDILEDIKKKSDIRRAEEKALNLLAYRGRSKKELQDRLARDTDEVSASVAVEKMGKLGLVDDKAFAEQYAHELLYNKRLSLSATKYKLRARGISEEVMEELFSEINIDEQQQVVFLLKGKFHRKIGDEKSKNRVVNSLIRMGYGYGVIKKAFSILGEDALEDEEYEI